MNIITKIFRLISKNQKKEASFVLFLILVGLIFEMLSIAIIFPIFDYSISPEKLEKLTDFLGIDQGISQRNFLIYSMSFLFLIYLFKTFFIYFCIRKQQIFSNNLVKDFSQDLFKGYIQMPYLFHVNNNSAKLIRNVTVETGAFLALLQSVLVLISEVAIILSVLILLFFVEFTSTLLMILFFLFSSFIFNSVTKKMMEKLGVKRQYHDGEYSKHLLQGLNGIKDIKILGKETYFNDKFYYHNNERSKILIKSNIIQQTPRLYIEFISIFALTFLVVYFVINSDELSDFLPTLSLYAASAFRIIPSLNRVLVSITTVKYHKSAIDEIDKELEYLRKNIYLRKNTKNSIKEFKDSVKLNNISFSYSKDKSNYILKKLYLKIKIGETVGIIGESGSGKSTLVDIIIGLISPSEGKYTIDSSTIKMNGISLNKIFGYVPQSINFIDDTLEKNIAFGVDEFDIDKEKVDMAIKSSQLNSFVKKLPEGIKTVIGEKGVKISGGQRQRIGIARALYFNPKILVFDEATSALDDKTEKAVMSTVLKLKGKLTIILIAHRLTTLESCDHVYKIEEGNVKKVQLKTLLK